MGTSTPRLALYKPDAGENGWAGQLNTSLDTLDNTATPKGTDSAQGNLGLLAWNFDPIVCQNKVTPTTARVCLYRVSVPVDITVTNVCTYTSDAVTLSAGCYGGLYSIAGSTATLIGATTDKNASWNGAATAHQDALVGGPYAITGGIGVFYYVGVLVTGSSLTQMFYGQANMSASFTGFGTSGAAGTQRFADAASGSTLPSSVSISGAGNAPQIWVGLS